MIDYNSAVGNVTCRQCQRPKLRLDTTLNRAAILLLICAACDMATVSEYNALTNTYQEKIYGPPLAMARLRGE